MPILLVFTLTAACLPVKWPAPLVGGGERTAVGLTVASIGMGLGAGYALRRWVLRTLGREPYRRAEVASVYSRLRRTLFFVNFGLAVLCVLVFGWGWFARRTFVLEQSDADGRPLLAPFAELAVPLPYFIILFVSWTIYYDAESALHRTGLFGPVARPFWSRGQYLLNQLRQFLLLILLPVLLFVTQQTVARFAPEVTQSDWYRFGTLATIPVLLLFLPLLVKPLLGLRPLPPGPTRDRLEALARRLHFRCTDFLLWPTHGATANALIVGLLPRVRYVIFTDRILEELPPDELDAVFGHEVGHAKYGHIWFYAAFLVLSVAVLTALLLWLGQCLDEYTRRTGWLPPDWVQDWISLPPILLMATYIFFVFGYLSRRCERQADVYGCRAVSCGSANCSGHDATTIYPEQARGLCPTGIRTFVRALERVSSVNEHPLSPADRRRSAGARVRSLLGWLRAWQHATMPQRVAFLLSLIEEPDRERRFQRSVRALGWGLILALAGILYALGELVGWREFLETL